MHKKELTNIIEKHRGETFFASKINGIQEHSVRWFQDLEFWIDTGILEKTKSGTKESYFWNACGIMRHKNVHQLDIAVQIGIETPYNPRRAGVFVKDELGKKYLAHTGKVNNKRNKELSPMKKYILQHIEFQKIFIHKKEVILIGCLSANDFVRNLADFTHAIAMLKKQIQ